MTARRTHSTALERMESTRSTSPVPLDSEPSGARLKVTVWRLLNTTVIMGFGIYKSYHTTLGSPTSDWIICVGWAVIAYWGTYVEMEAPTLASWLFIPDFSRPTRFFLEEAFTLASILGFPVLVYMWAFPNGDKPADRAVPTYVWIICVANALFAPSQFWDRAGHSQIFIWIRRRWMPRQFNDLDPTSELAGVFTLSTSVAGLVSGGQIVYNLYRFTRGSDPPPSLALLWLLTTGISIVFPLAICGLHLAAHRLS
ncbi:hypothetical protein B0H12DRAFT_1152519 [Mycena haematopus]|nr:hypothetical protein B0H12DRAFT_1152519 [Mycena haematopus]